MSSDATRWILGEGHWAPGGRHDLTSLKKIHGIVEARYGYSIINYTIVYSYIMFASSRRAKPCVISQFVEH